MNKYEAHNQKQFERHKGDANWIPLIATPHQFDLFKKLAPELIDQCVVSLFLLARSDSVATNNRLVNG